MPKVEVKLNKRYKPIDYRFGFATNPTAKVTDVNNWQDSNVFYVPHGTYLLFAKKRTGSKFFKFLHTVACGTCTPILAPLVVGGVRIENSCTIFLSNLNTNSCNIITNIS